MIELLKQGHTHRSVRLSVCLAEILGALEKGLMSARME
jgi:hypothetical protein